MNEEQRDQWKQQLTADEIDAARAKGQLTFGEAAALRAQLQPPPDVGVESDLPRHRQSEPQTDPRPAKPKLWGDSRSNEEKQLDALNQIRRSVSTANVWLATIAVILLFGRELVWAFLAGVGILGIGAVQ